MAVFTPVSTEQAAAFLDNYEIGALGALTPIAQGVENTNYRLTAGEETFVLTLYEKRVRPEDLPFYFGLAAHLADRGAPAPRTLPMRSGKMVGTLNDRPAAVITWLLGASTLSPSPGQARTAGAMLAKLHMMAGDYAPRLDNPWTLPAWRDLSHRCLATAIVPAHQDMAEDLAREVEHLGHHWPTDLVTGAIHGDYFPDNVLFTGDEITGVIDYYFACTDALAYDLAIAINAWGFDLEGAMRRDVLHAFCAGYHATRPLSGAEMSALPVLCRGAALRFTLTRLHDVIHHDDQWLVTPKDPAAFFARLTAHRDVACAEAYGFGV